MNRDEKLTRPIALPPSRQSLGTRHALFPTEPNGGTWVGVNDAAVTFALINWYSVPIRVTGQHVSRGNVVRSCLDAASPRAADSILNASPLNCVNPFRLIGIFPADGLVVEWCWNLERLEAIKHPWRTNGWISSGFDEPGAQRTRAKTVRNALRRTSVGTLDWLRRVHRSHAPQRGPYSVCMHRDDAATVSYTEVTVSRAVSTMRYHAGSPCEQSPLAPCLKGQLLLGRSSSRRQNLSWPAIE